jgi:sulfite reductase alpha subunit-like flavoprotein
LIACTSKGENCRRLIEIAVTVHDTSDWKRGSRTGVGSGFLERLAQQLITAEKQGVDPKTLNLHVPMFRGLMANPLAREFASDGPMLLIGAGVGIAPFRGFVINALDGRVFVCGSSKGMGEGVEAALVDVAMAKGNLNREEAESFWHQKKAAGQYIAVSSFVSCTPRNLSDHDDLGNLVKSSRQIVC